MAIIDTADSRDHARPGLAKLDRPTDVEEVPPAPVEAAPIDELVTVVIPCRNEESFIEACLDSVQSQTYRNIEILVVDGISDDRTAEIVRRRGVADPRVHLLDNPGRIVSPGLNVALHHAQGHWFVRIDAHCTVPSDYVEKVVKHLRTGDFGGVGGRKLGIGRSPVGRAVAAAMASPIGVGNSVYHYGDRPQHVEHVPFGAYPTLLARTIGGWDEAVVVNQDFEFDHRIVQSGQPILFDPDVFILWHCRQSIGDLFRQYRRYGRGKSVVTRLHPESIRARHLVPAAFVVGLAAMALPASRLPLIRFGRKAFAASYGATLAAGAVTARSVDPDGPPLTMIERATVTAAIAAMHLGQGLGFWQGLLRPSSIKAPTFVDAERTDDDVVIDLRDPAPTDSPDPSADHVIDLRDGVPADQH